MRLIDADELKKALAEMWYESAISITGVSVAELIDNAPTIEPIEDTKSCGVSADEYVPNKACFDCMERATGMCKGTIQEQSWCPIVAKTNTVPSGDLVNRKLLIGAIEKCGEEKIYPQALIQTINAVPSADRHEYNLDTIADIVRQLGHLDNLIADACDRPKGEWIIEDAHVEHCSVCGYPFYISALFAVGGNDEPNFCPNCGADMRGENDG